MITIYADFNDITEDKNILCHSERLMSKEYRRTLKPGTKVLVEDYEGNSCEGTILSSNRGIHYTSLNLDTWVHGDE